MQTDYQTNLDTQRSDVIQAEAKSDSWMASNWRPILMLTFTAIVAMKFKCPQVCKVEMSGWSPPMMSTSPDLSG